MRKYIIAFISFFALLLFSSSKVIAKSATKDNVTISFGEDLLYMRYDNINEFDIDNYKFFYDGIEHEFNSDYSLVDGLLMLIFLF